MSTALDKLAAGVLPVDFNWNSERHPATPVPPAIPAEPTPEQVLKVKIVSEDLRDGLHGVPVYPHADDMLRMVEALDRLGVAAMTVGIYPGGPTPVDRTIKAMLARMRERFPRVTPIVLSLATEASLDWAGDCKQIHPGLQAIVFIGTAPSRLLVEEWDRGYVLGQLGRAVGTAVRRHRIEVIGATEHTTQTPPDFLGDIVRTVVDGGASVFCIADTIGTARPVGAFRIVRFVRAVLDGLGAPDVLIDWHGHRDLGNDVANAMTAIAAGADRIHTVARGIGERAGNAQMEAVLLNCAAILDDAGCQTPWALPTLGEVLSTYSHLVGTRPPTHGPLGLRSHRTSLGIHTAAMRKADALAHEARQSNRPDLAARLERMARRIYVAVDPDAVGVRPSVGVGPWSGHSTVRLAWQTMGGDGDSLSADAIERALNAAKRLGRELGPEELKELLEKNDARTRERAGSG